MWFFRLRAFINIDLSVISRNDLSRMNVEIRTNVRKRTRLYINPESYESYAKTRLIKKNTPAVRANCPYPMCSIDGQLSVENNSFGAFRIRDKSDGRRNPYFLLNRYPFGTKRPDRLDLNVRCKRTT